MAVYLITSHEVYLNTPMGGNTDPDKFLGFITDVQVMVLENVLGTKLYDKILVDFAADNLSGLYLQMFNDYIKPVMWHSVFAEYIKIGSIIVGNGGVYKHTSQDAETASVDNINYVAKNAQSKADTYIERLIRFLCDKQSDIPEYTTTQDEDYDIKPKDALQTISGWFLTGGHNNDDCDGCGGTSNSGSGDYLELE